MSNSHVSVRGLIESLEEYMPNMQMTVLEYLKQVNSYELRKFVEVLETSIEREKKSFCIPYNEAEQVEFLIKYPNMDTAVVQVLKNMQSMLDMQHSTHAQNMKDYQRNMYAQRDKEQQLSHKISYLNHILHQLTGMFAPLGIVEPQEGFAERPQDLMGCIDTLVKRYEAIADKDFPEAYLQWLEEYTKAKEDENV